MNPKPFDCEIKTNEETIRRGIAGYRGKILERKPKEVVVQLWMDTAWGDPRIFKPEEIQDL